MSQATFATMSPGRRADLVEYVHSRLRRRAGLEPQPESSLSLASQVWLGRMRSALVSSDCSQKTFDELAAVYETYLKTLPEEEAQALQGRVRQFIAVRDAIVKATS
jgi:hypothetical protein